MIPLFPPRNCHDKPAHDRLVKLFLAVWLAGAFLMSIPWIALAVLVAIKAHRG